ncbi:MAG: GNAT family N-acetyltransferase [Ectothiorhodospiraceae bacterium]|jgi:RimJ/RimL family protein N-acetyltransferase
MSTIDNDHIGASKPIIRRLWWHERDLFRDHLLRLGARDRRMRFGGHVTDEFIRHYAGDRDILQRRLLGCFVDGELRGVGEFRLLGGYWPREAELAFSVEAPFQERGIGSELFRRTVTFARNRGLERVFITTLASNRPMQRMARRFGMRLRPCAGELEGRLELVAPNYLSVMNEFLEEGVALLWAAPRPVHARDASL